MASQPEGSMPVHTMKRTGRSPWSALARSSSSSSSATATPTAQIQKKSQPQVQPQAQKHDAQEVLPAWVVSDVIVPPTPTVTAPVPTLSLKPKPLATTSKITALQREWEKNKQQTEQASKGVDSANTADDAEEELQKPPAVVQKPPAMVQKPPAMVQKSPVVVQKPPAMVQKPPAMVQKSPAVVQKPPAIVQKPPVVVQPPVSASDSVQLEQPQETPKPAAPSPALRPVPGTWQTSRESTGTPGASAAPQAPSTAIARETAIAGVVAQAQRHSEEAVLKKMETVIKKKAKKRSGMKAKPAHSKSSPDQRVRLYLTSSMLLGQRKKELKDSATSESDYSVTDVGDKDSQNHSSNSQASKESTPLMIDQTPDGKSYYVYTAADGSTQGTKGTPFPPGYTRSDLPGQPFICPVRECRALFPNIHSMASHFHGRHNGAQFNDNGDGTFSKTGSYTNKWGTSPGIVVSQNPLPPGAPPPASPAYVGIQKRPLGADVRNLQPSGSSPLAAPAVPRDQKRLLDADKSSSGDRPSKRPRATPVPLPTVTPVYPPLTTQGGKMPTTELLRYLNKFLSPRQKVPDRADVRALANFPRVRDLPTAWVEFYRGKTLDSLTYACALAYLTGKQVTEPNTCRRWLGIKHRQTSYACVALPANLSAAARAAFSMTPTCIACRYYCICFRQGDKCGWNLGKLPPVKDYEKKEPEPMVEDKEMKSVVKQQYDESLSEHSSEPDFPSWSDSELDVETGSEQEPGRASNPEPAPTETQSALSRSGLRRHQLTRTQATTGPVPPTAASRITPAISQMSAADLEMEEWEVAPGTISDETTNERIGFSNAYMTSGQAITVSPDIGFNVLTLRSGTSHHWPAQRNKVRTCSVGSGKVKVKIGGQTFKLGTNGLIVIRPGQSCTVENRLYIDAVLHCLTVQDYELLSDGERT